MYKSFLSSDMSVETRNSPTQEGLFTTEPPRPETEKPGSFAEEVVQVDRGRHRAIIMVDGYEFTCALIHGRIDFVAHQGADSINQIPTDVRARAKQLAGGILRA
jgi:hypothetical protein